MEKMLVAEALDERDCLRKKILEKISELNVVAVVKASDTTTENGRDIEKFKEEAKSQVQSIRDMITRYKNINLAISKSNATETITVDGKTMTRAEAIALRKDHTVGSELEELLNKNLIKKAQNAQIRFAEKKNLYEKAKDRYIQTMLSSEGAKELSEDKINAVDALTKGDVPVLIDPNDIVSNIDTYIEKQEKFYKDLDTAIKVSNASTTIEI